MSHELIIQPEAEADIAEAVAWYEAGVAGLGSEFFLVLDATFNSILRNPTVYPLVHKRVRRALTRRFPATQLQVILRNLARRPPCMKE